MTWEDILKEGEPNDYVESKIRQIQEYCGDISKTVEDIRNSRKEEELKKALDKVLTDLMGALMTLTELPVKSVK